MVKHGIQERIRKMQAARNLRKLTIQARIAELIEFEQTSKALHDETHKLILM